MSKAEWIWTVYQQAVEGHAAGHFLYLAAFAVHASRLHIYLAIWDRQSFLAHDGIQTLDMLSLGFGPNKDRFSSWRTYQRRVYLYQQKLQGIGGSMVEFSPATWEIRVQFRPMQEQPPFK